MRNGKKLFAANPDEQTGFWRFMTILFAEFFDLVKTNLLFLAVSLGTLTIPAAIAGMARVTLHLMEGKNHFLGKDFFGIFRQKFLRSLGLGATVLAAAVFTGISVYFYTMVGRENGAGFYVLSVMAVGLFLFVQMTAVCAFPLLALTDLEYRKLIPAAIKTAVSNAGRAFAAAFINTALFIASILLNPGSIIFTIFIEFSFMSFIASFLMFPAWKPYLDEAKERQALSTGAFKEAAEEETVL